MVPHGFFVILAATVISQVSSCGPGFEDERAELQEYLGIEWKEDGLSESAQSFKKYIHQSNELDCDFTKPALCKWRNANPDSYPDTMDFYLFEKTDFKEFPYIQVRPGPALVHEGEKLLLAGNTKRDEQSAVWVSSPIFCQNSTGKLTFTFWLYNEALVEVLVLRETDEHVLKAIYEKPFVDCGPFQVQDTECVVEIMPQKEPFIIAIRAYNMKKKEGSFVLIDNIRYNATLCKTSIDLGDGFIKEPLVTSSKGAEIKSASDLNCADFDEPCRWRNGLNTGTAWLRGKDLTEAGKWFNATGTYDMPTGQFAMIYIKEDIKNPYDVLRSDPIPCQLAERGSISFRYWFTREVEVRVCTMTLDFTALECNLLLASASPGPVTLSVVGPVSLPVDQPQQPFMIAFEVLKVNPDFDNFIAIDDIRYEAILCSDVIDPWDLGASFASATLLNLLYGKALHEAKDVSCDFEERARMCAWANPEGQQDQWDIGSGPPNAEKFAKLTGTPTSPNGTFAVARFNSSGGTASLLTEPIQCLNTAGTISFRFWMTKGAEVQLCITEEDITVDLDCQSIDLLAPGPVIVDIPPIPAPFRLRIRAISTEKATVIVDDVQFEGDICPTPDSNAAVLRPLSEQENQADANACRLLSCDFNADNMCLYKSTRVPGSLSIFQMVTGKILDGNSVNEPNIYIQTRLFPRGKMAVLESPTFALNGDGRLHFNYRRNNNASAVYVCQDTFEKELEECYKLTVWEDVKPNEWVDDYIDLVNSDTKLYIIAKFEKNDNEKARTSSVSIDNIRLTDSYDNLVC